MVEWGELFFKIVRLEKAGQEVLARAGKFMVARAAFDTSVSLWSTAEIELRQGAADPFVEAGLNPSPSIFD